MIVFTASILHGKEDEFAKELYHLSQEKEFNLLNFEDVIDKIRSYVAEVSVYAFING